MRKVVLATLLLAAAGCGGKKSNNNNNAPAPQPPPQLGITDDTAAPLLTTYCAPCHNSNNGHKAPMGILLDTPANAKANQAQIDDAVKELTVTDDGTKEDMPPTDMGPNVKQPSEDERSTLVKWFQQK